MSICPTWMDFRSAGNARRPMRDTFDPCGDRRDEGFDHEAFGGRNNLSPNRSIGTAWPSRIAIACARNPCATVAGERIPLIRKHQRSHAMSTRRADAHPVRRTAPCSVGRSQRYGLFLEIHPEDRERIRRCSADGRDRGARLAVPIPFADGTVRFRSRTACHP